jgi:hypothetical protein
MFYNYGKNGFLKFLSIQLRASFWDLINTRLKVKVKVYGNSQKVLFLLTGIL